MNCIMKLPLRTTVAGKRRNPDVSGVQKAASTAVNTQTASDGGDISQSQTPGDAGKSQSRTPSELEDIPYIRAGRQRQFPLPHFIRAVRYWPISVRAGRWWQIMVNRLDLSWERLANPSYRLHHQSRKALANPNQRLEMVANSGHRPHQWQSMVVPDQSK